MIGTLIIYLVLAQVGDAGTPGEIFYYGLGAGPISLGRSFTASDGSAESFYYNPATIWDLQRGNLKFHYDTPYSTHNFTGISYAYPLDPHSGIGFSVFGIFSQAIRARDEYGLPGRVFRIVDMGGLVAYGRRMRGKIAAGANFKFIYKDVMRYVGAGVGLDLGVVYEPTKNLKLGSSILNVIPPSYTLFRKKETVKPVLRVGFQYKPIQGIRVLMDLVKPLDKQFRFSTGLEVIPIRFFALRLGYDPIDYSFGIGLNTKKGGIEINLEYTFSNNHLSDAIYPYSHRLSLNFKYGGYRVWVHSDPDLISLVMGGRELPLTYIYIHVKTKAKPHKWNLRILTEAGELVREFYGEGIPPLRIDWDGRDVTGRFVPRGKYYYEIFVIDEANNTYQDYGYLLRVIETSVF